MPQVYSYALLRLVPRVERQEFVNIGAIVYGRDSKVITAEALIDEARIRALYPGFDLAAVLPDIESFLHIAHGKGSSPIASLPASERFHWLVAVRSTVLQTSPVHTGTCGSVSDCLRTLLDRYVA